MTDQRRRHEQKTFRPEGPQHRKQAFRALWEEVVVSKLAKEGTGWREGSRGTGSETNGGKCVLL